MVQKEVGERFFAKPGTKAYGAVSVLVQLAAIRTGTHAVSRTVFRPRPRVDSMLVAFTRRRDCRTTTGSRTSSGPPSRTGERRCPTRSRSPGLPAGRSNGRARRARPRGNGARRESRSGGVRAARGAAVKATIAAPAKINLALVVGPRREDGKHEIVTVYERIALEDTLTLEPADGLRVDGFPADTLVTLALTSLAGAAGVEPAGESASRSGFPWAPGWAVAAPTRPRRCGSRTQRCGAARRSRLHELAAALGADVPLFLTSGPQLGEGDGTELTPLELPRDYAVLVLLPTGATKRSTKSIYDAFDDRQRRAGFAERRDELIGRLSDIASLTDIAGWPRNDLASLATRGRARAARRGAGRCQRCRAGALRPLRERGRRAEGGRRARRPGCGMGRISSVVRLIDGRRAGTRGAPTPPAARHASSRPIRAGCARTGSMSRSGSPSPKGSSSRSRRTSPASR